MLYFLGNCQMDFLSRAMADRGHDCTYRVLASPLTYTSSPGTIPAEFDKKVRTMGLGDFFHDRAPMHQFQMLTPDDSPNLIVLSLFHENTPLFIHKRDNYIFFMDPAAWQDNPELKSWIETECGMIQPKPATYLKRYGDMLATLRHFHPNIPIVVAARLSHHPAFGPDPYSYLKSWTEQCATAREHYQLWQTELDNVHIVEMDRLFGGIWEDSDKIIDTHCPFLKIKLEETDGQITGLHASRDVEHIGSMWPKLADTLENFMESGAIQYDEKQTIPAEWSRPWQPRPMAEDIMLQKLSSGANYMVAHAVGAFFLDLTRDFSPLLAQTGHLTPVCHNTLHMIKAYATIAKNPVLADWCDAHRITAESFTANGPLYRDDYLKRIDFIKNMVTT